MWTQLFFLTVVGAAIGWLTNRIAVWMLFHPRRALRVPLTPWRIQGVLPRRQVELAEAVAETVRRELLPPEALMSLWEQSGVGEEVTKHIRRHVAERAEDKALALLPKAVRAGVSALLADIAAKEARHLLDRVVPELGGRLAADPTLQVLVQEKIEGLDLDELERLVWGLAGTELRHIEVLGAILGGAIGLVQASILMLWLK